nr:ORF3 [Torque teno felis virus]
MEKYLMKPGKKSRRLSTWTKEASAVSYMKKHLKAAKKKLNLKGKKRRYTTCKNKSSESSESSSYSTTSDEESESTSQESFWSDPEFPTPEQGAMSWTQFIDKLCSGPLPPADPTQN